MSLSTELDKNTLGFSITTNNAGNILHCNPEKAILAVDFAPQVTYASGPGGMLPGLAIVASEIHSVFLRRLKMLCMIMFIRKSSNTDLQVWQLIMLFRSFKRPFPQCWRRYYSRWKWVQEVKIVKLGVTSGRQCPKPWISKDWFYKAEGGSNSSGGLGFSKATETRSMSEHADSVCVITPTARRGRQ